MPAVGGYGYNATLAIFEEGFGPSVGSCYITQNAGYPSEISGNLDTPIYNGPDNASANNFERGNYIISVNDTDIHYNYKITKTETAYIVELFDENNESVESVLLDITGNDGAVQYSGFSFAVLCEYSDAEEPPIIRAGIGCEYFGLNLITGMPIEGSPHCFQWFNSARAVEILKDCIRVRRFEYEGGTVVTRLKESDNFIITQLPEETFSKEVVNTDNQLYSQMIPLNEDFEETDFYKNLWAWHPRNTYNEFSGSNIFHSCFDVHTAFLDYYKDAVGSELMRKTNEDKYTNAGSIEVFNYITINDNSKLFRINFSGGYAQWRNQTTSGQSSKYLDFYNENDILLDTWHVNGGNTSPSAGTPNENRRINVSTAFLCKSGSNFYIVGQIVYIVPKDSNGNTLPDNYYYYSGGYVVLKKLNTVTNELLNEATETIIEYDPENIDDTSEAGSTPQDSNDLYDRSSKWDSGSHAGENTGIRHNGSEQINASNGELTGDHPVGQVPEYQESGPNRIPTPLNTKMIIGFAPTPEEMETFSDLMKQTDFIDKMIGYFTNAVDGIISAHTCIAPALDKGPDCYLKYGLWDTSLSGLTMKTLTQKMYHCYMGTLNLLEERNSYKDYPPFCNYKIYLPYIGERDIDGRVLVGKQLSLYYHINVLTGDILAELRVENQNSFITSSFYYWQGNTLEPFPLTSRDFSSQIQSGINAILSTGTAIASGVSGNALGAFTGGISAVKNISDTFKPDIRMIGTVGGNMAQNMFGQAYIIKEYPYLSETNPFNYERLKGIPSNIGNLISKNATGTSGNPKFISFRSIDLYDIKTQKGKFDATDNEKEELETLLKSGVYV